jgi:hypothetical protein
MIGGDDNKPEIFMSVAYYPFPGKSLEAAGTGNVVLKWLPPKYTERNWPYADPAVAASSAWPSLTGGLEDGEPIYAREVKQYNIWRSTTQTGPWTLVGTTTALYASTYVVGDSKTDYFMWHPVDSGGAMISASNKISYTDTPGNGTWYYAVTTQENSDLESQTLSEILEVTVAGGNVTGTSVVAVEGQTGFWTTKSSAPSTLTAVQQAVTTHYKLDWTDLADTKVRYYNVYYREGSNPTVNQIYRIASIPPGLQTWLDWNVTSAVTPYYAITAVDRYGNESDPKFAIGGGPTVKYVIGVKK